MVTRGELAWDRNRTDSLCLNWSMRERDARSHGEKPNNHGQKLAKRGHGLFNPVETTIRSSNPDPNPVTSLLQDK